MTADGTPVPAVCPCHGQRCCPVPVMPSPARPADQAREARPELHTLYRFWVSAAASDQPVDQEFEGWWSGRNWHALYDIGIWDPEFVVRFAPLADEERAADRAEIERQAALLRAIEDCHRDPARAILKADQLAGEAIIRAHAAEARLDALVADLRTAISDMAYNTKPKSEVLDYFADRFRAVLDKHAGEQAQGGEGRG